MEKVREKLGLSTEATEEEILKKLDEKDSKIKTLEQEKTTLSDKNKELTTSVEEKNVELEKLKLEVKEKFEQSEKDKEDKQPEDIFDELASY